ncbi:hypothetical protein M422DRAFT_176820 [Sphaerobolus stellatus SS14]|uniref:Uncharacterized protein n=1 Tax=Sphaerobolus stellatus (strain SS14) TaxID=990650 RepID=A0A0C9VKU1_SPHS4|nr:hypothetical protein M422DRAFT_176820 [Sphaerobolus stellatus SS14]
MYSDGTGSVPTPQATTFPVNNINYSKKRFSSPLYSLNHAPLLWLFLPSPNGAWLSDESVMECEKELKRAGIVGPLRAGDAVWDTAVADEMNAGRLVWDGNCLIDLDYSYSHSGELPRYLNSFAFPPSYFHKVIRSTGNPLDQMDISPWSTDIAANVQLLQDKTVAETYAQHSILRWTHRTRFIVHPNFPLPNTDPQLIVDPKWVGTVVVEAEGTNEGLADLLGRCNDETCLTQKVLAATGGLSVKMAKGDAGRVFRILRARSRPGEIWMRCVREKENLVGCIPRFKIARYMDIWVCFLGNGMLYPCARSTELLCNDDNYSLGLL